MSHPTAGEEVVGRWRTKREDGKEGEDHRDDMKSHEDGIRARWVIRAGGNEAHPVRRDTVASVVGPIGEGIGGMVSEHFCLVQLLERGTVSMPVLVPSTGTARH